MKIETERLRIEVEGLGLIEVYRDQKGYCCDINGKRAWSAWKDNLRGIELTLRSQIKSFEYLNSFRTPEEYVKEVDARVEEIKSERVVDTHLGPVRHR